MGRWKTGAAESIPVAMAAPGSPIVILFRYLPGKSGKFHDKNRVADWDEWKTEVPEGNTVSVTVTGHNAYLLFKSRKE